MFLIWGLSILLIVFVKMSCLVFSFEPMWFLHSVHLTKLLGSYYFKGEQKLLILCFFGSYKNSHNLSYGLELIFSATSLPAVILTSSLRAMKTVDTPPWRHHSVFIQKNNMTICFFKWMIFVNNKQQNSVAKSHLSHQNSSLFYNILLFAVATVLDEADLETVEGFISRMSSRKCCYKICVQAPNRAILLVVWCDYHKN